MMTNNSKQFNFLEAFALDVLKSNGIKLSAEQEKLYVPQIMAQIELRLGLEMVPKLNDAQKETMTKLLSKTDTTAQEWKSFWEKSVPTFEADTKKVMLEFAEKSKQIFAAQA